MVAYRDVTLLRSVSTRCAGWSCRSQNIVEAEIHCNINEFKWAKRPLQITLSVRLIRQLAGWVPLIPKHLLSEGIYLGTRIGRQQNAFQNEDFFLGNTQHLVCPQNKFFQSNLLCFFFAPKKKCDCNSTRIRQSSWYTNICMRTVHKKLPITFSHKTYWQN